MEHHARPGPLQPGRLAGVVEQDAGQEPHPLAAADEARDVRRAAPGLLVEGTADAREVHALRLSRPDAACGSRSLPLWTDGLEPRLWVTTGP